MEDIWMLAYEVSYSEFTQGGTYPSLQHGYFTNEEAAQAKADSVVDGIDYIVVKCEPGQVTPLAQHTDPTPLDFSDYPDDFYYRKYPTEAPSESVLRAFAQFALPGREAEALEFICDYGNHGYTFEKGGLYDMSAWVADAVAKILTGDNYDAFLAYSKAGEDGPQTYSWPGENLTVENCPDARRLGLDYSSYVVPGSGLTALYAIFSNMQDGAHHIQFGINLATQVLTGANYDRLVKDSDIEWIPGIPG